MPGAGTGGTTTAQTSTTRTPADGDVPADAGTTTTGTTTTGTTKGSRTGTSRTSTGTRAKKGTGKSAAPAARPAAKPARKSAPQPAAKSATSKRSPAKRAAGPEEEGTTAAAALPVREGEDRWTGAELADVRAVLIGQMAGLEAEIAASTSQIAEGDAADGAGDDQADTGAKTYAREHELSLAYNSRDLLVQTERAVQRIDAGTYGICESCGGPVGKARLQAFPRATLCVSCKQREERR